MNSGTLHGTIMNLDSSFFALTQIDRSVRKYLTRNQKDQLWVIVSDLIDLYGSSAERQFLYSLISLVVTTQSQLQLPASSSSSSPSASSSTSTTPATSDHPVEEEEQESVPEVESSKSSLLATAQKLILDHYHLDFTKPIVATAFGAAFQSFKKSSTSAVAVAQNQNLTKNNNNNNSDGNGSSASSPLVSSSPVDYLKYLSKGLNLSIYREVLCCLSFYNRYVNIVSSSSSSECENSTTTSKSEDILEVYRYTCTKVNEFLTRFPSSSSEPESKLRADVLLSDSVCGSELNSLLLFLTAHPHEFPLESQIKFFTELRNFYNPGDSSDSDAERNQSDSLGLVPSPLHLKLINRFFRKVRECKGKWPTAPAPADCGIKIGSKMALDPESRDQVITFDPGAVEFVLELGPGICNTVEECRATLATVGPHKLTPAALARIMVGMIKAQDIINQQQSQSNSNSQQGQGMWGDRDGGKDGAGNNSSGGEKGQTWNAKVFVQAVLDVVPNLKWLDVIHELDFQGFYIKDGKPYRSLMEALRYSLQVQGVRQEQFPVDVFYRRWNNTEGQASLIKCCLNTANVDIFSFADHPYHSVVIDMLKTSGDKSYELKEIQVWKSIQLLELLMWLSDAGHYALVQDLFQFPVTHCPDILLVGLIQLNSPVNILRQELMAVLFPIFLNNHVNSGVILQHAWHSGSTSIRPIMIHAMAEWYLRGEYDQTKLSRILDVAQDLKALPLLLNANSHVFIIDLACLASRREFLKLDKWLSDKMREHGEVFIVSLIKVLNRRVPFVMGKDDGNNIPKTAQLPPETVNTMIQCLHQCVGKVSPEVGDSILSMVTTYNILLNKARPGAQSQQQQQQQQQPPPNVLRSHRTPLEAAFASVNPSSSPGLFSNNSNNAIGGIPEPNLSNLGSTLAGLTLAGLSNPNIPPLGPTPGSPSRLLGPNFGGPNAPPNLPAAATGAYPMLAGLQMGGPNVGVGNSVVSAQAAAISGLGNPMGLLSGRMTGPGGPGSGPGPGQGGPAGGLAQSVIGAGGSGSAGDKRGVGASGGAADPALLFNEIQPGDISKEAEDEANSYFHRIYSKPPDPTMSIDEVLDLLKRFQESPIRREREVFTCMLRNLFEEYKFFPQYPEKELHTTAQLFGGIIEHGLVSTYLQLGVALRFVVDALKKPPGSKMYYFGLAALDRFKTRLKEYPQYCQHLSTIPHFQQFPDILVEFVECGARSQEPTRPNGGSGGRPSVPSTPLPVTSNSLPGISNSSTINNSTLTNSHANSNNTSTPSAVPGQGKPSIATTANSTPQTNSKASTVASGPSITGRPSIANATNITTLLMATEKEEKITTPPENVQDKTAFIFNNLNQMNLAQKCDELKDIIGQDHWHWVSQYLVMKRASIELNFHTLYSNLLDTLRVAELNHAVLRETHRNIKILLKTDKSAGNFSDRQLLKNLGHWLGMITVMRNKPIILDDLDIKSLIIEAYRKGLQDLLYVVPFAAKIMESCARSLVFKPPCPWTMAILNVLAELHREPDMKLNLKFEIEVLCKALAIEVSDLKPKGLLKDDTAFKIHVPQLSYPSLGQSSVQQSNSVSDRIVPSQPPSRGPAAEALVKSVSSVQTPVGVEPQQQQQQQQQQQGKITQPTPPPVLASAALAEDSGNKVASSSPTLLGSTASLPGVNHQQGQGPGASAFPGMSTTPTLPLGLHEPKFSYMEIDTTNLPSLLGHIVVNSQLPLFQTHQTLKQYIRPAVEKAIQDLLGPVVERSIKYTINACEQIIKKDFAMDHEENRMRIGAHHMMRYLTAGMAMITSRDHIFIAISTNLKQGFLAAIRLPVVSQDIKELIDQASTVIAQDNMELACVFIQKTAVEKALAEIDKRLTPEYDCRKGAKGEGRRYCDAVMLAYQTERIPEPIRVKPSQPSGPLAQQLAVYEDFSRNIPGFLPPTEGEVPFLSPKFQNTSAPNPVNPNNTLPGGPGQGVNPVLVSSAAAAPGAGDEILAIYEKLLTEIQNYFEGLTLSHTSPQLSGGIRALVDAIGHARNTRSIVAAIALLQKAIEGLLEGLAAFPQDPEIIRYRDAHLMVLKALQDPRAFGQAWVNRQVTKCLIEIRPELKYNIEAVDTLIRANLVSMLQFDAHLATAMEKGQNVMVVAFAMQLVQMYLIDERYSSTVSENDLYHTVDMLARCATVNRQHPEGLVHLIDVLRSSASQGQGQLGQGQGQGQQGQGPAESAVANFVADRAPGGSTTHIHSGMTQSREYDDPQGFVEKSEMLLREWVRLYLTQGTPKDSSKAFATFIHELNNSGILKSDDIITRFFRICVQCCVNQVYQGLQAGPLTLVRSKCYQSVDALVRLVALLIRHIGDAPPPKISLLNKFLGIVAGILIQEHELQKAEFQQLPFHRMFMMLFYDLNGPDPVFETISMQVLTGFSNTMHILNPSKVPGFAYAWLEIIGNRLFIARMLALAADRKCWAMYCQLILDLFRFLFPFLRNAELAKPVATLYRGTLRVLLVVLHDFPDFLCDYCYHFLDAIPPNCIQMRNLVLSAFPRNMRLPDPFTANLKFEMLADTAMAPRILSNVGAMIQPPNFKKDLDSYLSTRTPVTFLSEIRTNLQVANEPGTRYNIPLMNALVLYVGSQHIQVIRGRNQTPNMSTVAHTSHMDIFQNLAVDLDTEGRYLFLNALANQLRFPSSHTHYFSLVILYLFAQSNTEDVQEQITRVLLERLVVNRPHPWGLLVTFIELIKNPAYKFWQHEFVHCAPEVEKLFESVARSCMVTKSAPLTGGSGATQSGLNLVNATGGAVDQNGGLLVMDGPLDQL